ncbi:transposon Tf2-11 polyprotein [Trichonephila clavipes]|nr:transposon Tf2-11 polyprotein [Trichonephila clavipes]
MRLGIDGKVKYSDYRSRLFDLIATPGSSFTPTPLGHEDNLEVRHHPRANALQWHPARFNFPHPEVGDAAGLGSWPEAMNKFRTYLDSLPVKGITDHAALTRLTNGKNLYSRMIRWVLKLAEFNIGWEHRSGTQNAVADVLSRNLVGSIVGEQVRADIAILGRLRACFMRNVQRHYVKCECTFQSLEGMKEFHDKPIASHFGHFKTYHKIRDAYYFPYMRKFIDQYVSTCHMCQIDNYKNALPAARLIPIVSNYPNEIVTLDLLGPYPTSRVRRNRYVIVITDHFRKWAEIIPLKKASAQQIADNFFDSYTSRFGAPVKLIIDNSPQLISDIFENLSERLGIRHVKTVAYRPQANRIEHVNHDLVQMIANYVNDQHDTWDHTHTILT